MAISLLYLDGDQMSGNFEIMFWKSDPIAGAKQDLNHASK